MHLFWYNSDKLSKSLPLLCCSDLLGLRSRQFRYIPLKSLPWVCLTNLRVNDYIMDTTLSFFYIIYVSRNNVKGCDCSKASWFLSTKLLTKNSSLFRRLLSSFGRSCKWGKRLRIKGYLENMARYFPYPHNFVSNSLFFTKVS